MINLFLPQCIFPQFQLQHFSSLYTYLLCWYVYAMLCAHMFLPIAKYIKHCQVGIDSLYNLTLLVKVVIPCFVIVNYKDK